MDPEVVVIGAGTVGAAIGYGLASRGVRTLVLDGDDGDFRAANANFGLVWLQGKGMDMPAYQRLTRSSVDDWDAFGEELADVTGIGLQYENSGGLMICLGEEEFEQRKAMLWRLHNQIGGEPDFEMLDRASLARLLPKVELGPEVTGAGFGRRDGHTNPLRLLAALHAGILRKGGSLRGGCRVQKIQADGAGFSLDTGSERIRTSRIVIAAGLGTKELAAQVGLAVPVRPQRGQILVTERVEPFLPLPMSGLRQTREGTVMIGATQDESGFDNSTTTEAATVLSSRAVRRIPALAEARLVRQWAGLRILTPDGHPIYAESQTHPGAFVAICHSGVTLAAAHASTLADAIVAGALPSSLEDFHHRRFDVPQAA
ncbi:FAD-dependent oxidoreductase [Sphingomonas sp. LB2R24]|uniref:NAD(P)/FAD-dependent oxidoreductase n=1 Tax=Sphingomonas sorbitolis TaxID=3096165 RepID=UPI002FC87A17